MLEEYYRLQNWTEEGVPRLEWLRELGLDEFASLAGY
jgi:aldehyde:ferredoxin oxidoreductase